MPPAQTPCAKLSIRNSSITKWLLDAHPTTITWDHITAGSNCCASNGEPSGHGVSSNARTPNHRWRSHFSCYSVYFICDSSHEKTGTDGSETIGFGCIFVLYDKTAPLSYTKQRGVKLTLPPVASSTSAASAPLRTCKRKLYMVGPNFGPILRLYR